MAEIVFAIMALAVVLTAVSLLVPVAERLQVPHTVLLMVFGMALGLLGSWVAKNGMFGVVGDVFWGLQRIGLSADAFLFLFLPPLLFTAGLMIDVRRLWDEFAAVLLLAIVAVLVCIAFVGGLVHLATGVNVVACLLLGAIVSTTDPAAVIGVFRDVGAPKRLSILAEGESLFNDAAAITTFTILIDILVRAQMPGIATPFLDFGWDFLGGVTLGYGLARIAIFVLPRIGESSVAAASITVALAYLAFAIGDHYLHVSGVVAVVVAALTLAALGPTRVQPRQWEGLLHTWHQMDFWANSLIFTLAAMVAVNALGHLEAVHLWAIPAVIVAAFAARALTLFGLLPILEWARLVQAVDTRYKTMIVWGGLRGAVTVVLSLVAASNDRLPQDIQQFVAILAMLFVLFTLFVNALTLRPLMRLFGLDKLTATELALRDRVMRLSRVTIARQVHETARAYGIEGDVARRIPHLIVHPEGEDAKRLEEEMALSAEERAAVGLLTLCNRERELYLEHFAQQTVSRRMVGLLVAGADRLIDRVKTEGVPGYDFALRRIGENDRGFRFALWLQRRFGWEGPLSDRLADRFEALLISQLVLDELIEFDRHTVTPLLGAVTGETLLQLIETRRAATERALKALSLQYGGYAETIRDQHLQRAALRFEAAEYERQLRDGAIGREVYRDLQGGLAARRAAAARRPPLDLGLELTAMIGRVPLFRGLDTAAIREVGRRLRARLAVPDEPIVSVGEKGDAMYFIAAGEVAVRGRFGEATLKEGDFFGEMALVDHVPRNADVVALGYCHLLALEAGDFNALLEARPDLRGAIETVARQRRGEPAPAAASAEG